MHLSGDRTKRKKKIFFYSVFWILLLSVQTVLMPRLRLFGQMADLPMLSVAAIAFYTNEKEGGVVGLCAGIGVTALCETGISFAPLLLMVTGYFLGSAARFNTEKNLFLYLISQTLACLVSGAGSFIAAALVSTQFHLTELLLHMTLPGFGFNLGLSLLLYPAYRLLFGRAAAKQSPYRISPVLHSDR